jgi:hypothetical protein
MWAIYAGSIAAANRETRLQSRWSTVRVRARAVSGEVRSRTVRTSDDGLVTEFTLTVEVEDAAPFAATWHPHREARAYLLQPQVPNAGAPVRAWLINDGRNDPPVVVEVVDPSIPVAR